MNISKSERRVLDALALGGRIVVEKDERNRIVEIDCITREGWYMDGFDLLQFKKLRTKRLIGSRDGGPYRITRRGVEALQAARG